MFDGYWLLKVERPLYYFVARVLQRYRNTLTPIWLYEAHTKLDSWVVQRHQLDTRPPYHMCCNGNAGGWRTKLCDYLEEGWRYAEDDLYYKEEQS